MTTNANLKKSTLNKLTKWGALYKSILIADAKNYLENLDYTDIDKLSAKLKSHSYPKFKFNIRTLKKNVSSVKLFVNKLVMNAYKDYAKARINEYNALMTDESIDALKHIELRAEWHKSYMWGNCPTAEGWVNNSYIGKAHASGCGYDKLSTVYNSILCDSKVFRKAILIACFNSYDTKAHAFKNIPYGIYADNKYGVSIHFGGCGVETLRGILEWLGYTQKNIREYGFNSSDLFILE